MYWFRDDECDEILHEVDDETLNTDLCKIMLSDVVSPTSEMQVAVTLAIAEWSYRVLQTRNVGLRPIHVIMNLLSNITT